MNGACGSKRYNRAVQLAPEARAPQERPEEVVEAVVVRRSQPLWRSLLEILIALGIIVALYGFLFTSVNVAANDMSPTLRAGQRVLISRLPYRLTSPQRGDIVAVRSRIDPSQVQLYRVIGVPGDVLNIRGAQVAINALPLREPYLAESQGALSVGATTVGQYRIGQDNYFILNDNRFDLNDSRSFGTISRNEIIGRAWLVYWPLQDLAAVPHLRPHSEE